MTSSRRSLLAAMAPSVGVALAGCSGSRDTPDESGNSSDGDDEPATVGEFKAALKSDGITVDDTMSIAGNVSLMYVRDPDAPRDQLETVALTFADHRTVVAAGGLLSVTALESNTERHGVTDIPRKWADRYVNGDLDKKEYIRKVTDDYITV